MTDLRGVGLDGAEAAAPAPPARRPRGGDARRSGVLAAGIVAFFVAVHLFFAFRPILRVQKWRQADTSAVSRNLAFESHDLLRPRIDMRGDRTGITGMEFPAYQGTVALAMRALGTGADAVGKVIALLATLGAWWAVATVLVRRFGISAVSALAALAASPLLFVYGSRFMPESFALFFAALAAERFDAWWDRRGSVRLAVAAGAIMIAVLVRPFVAFLGLPMVVGAAILARRRDRAALAVAALGVAALVPFAAWYFWWVPHLVRTYGIDYFFMGRPLRENLAVLAKPEPWRLLFHALSQEYFSWQLLPVAALGAVALHRRVRGRPDAWAWRTFALGVPAATVACLLLLTGRHFWPHVYYFIALVPAVALAVAAGFDDVGARWPRVYPWVVAAAVVALPASLFHEFRRDPDVDRYASVLPEVAARIPPDDLVAVEDRGWYAWHLHPLRRRGWVEKAGPLRSADHMADLARRGCRWVIWEDGTRYHVDAIDEWIAKLRATGGGAAAHPR